MYIIDINKIITSFIAAMLLALSPGIGHSQNIDTQSSVSHRMLNDDGARHADTKYSLESGITVKKALETISQQEDLILSYDSDLLESTDEISISDNNHNTIDNVLQEVLSDTELEFKIMQTRHLVIYDRGKIGHVTGKVVDAETWDYLKDAKVYLLKADADTSEKGDVEKATYVDSTGRYDINNVDEGTYKLIVTFDGYERASKMIEIRNKQTTEKIFELQRNK